IKAAEDNINDFPSVPLSHSADTSFATCDAIAGRFLAVTTALSIEPCGFAAKSLILLYESYNTYGVVDFPSPTKASPAALPAPLSAFQLSIGFIAGNVPNSNP